MLLYICIYILFHLLEETEIYFIYLTLINNQIFNTYTQKLWTGSSFTSITRLLCLLSMKIIYIN